MLWHRSILINTLINTLKNRKKMDINKIYCLKNNKYNKPINKICNCIYGCNYIEFNKKNFKCEFTNKYRIITDCSCKDKCSGGMNELQLYDFT